ncbi:hypothetical protein O6H91_06G002500 [Diphasiastrum complanatum]|uniref:Uncharacterized protein n=2 Tax=Diphasiastrum complanatum TaxID=34168 RepID=A0ACC2DAE3_DIPCM|nr:hypothetical protein O6H91_06G001800 [Diphasiastrum complanatum]KAJ7551170.1 hypothetical protein O6H91_06G002500 [Diphasiastrum complanatum]
MNNSSARGTRKSGFCVFVIFVSLTIVPVLANDADPLQDFCVAQQSTILLNGLICKDPSTVNASDFAFHGLGKPGSTSNKAGSAVTPAFAAQFPALNTLGLSMARLDFAPGGLVTLHTHPRATEVLYLAEGTLYVGFVDTANTLFAQTLQKGDLFIFPKGLLHFQLNVGKVPALAISALNSQNPGVQLIPNALFGSDISNAVLEKAFNIGKKQVERLKSKFSS